MTISKLQANFQLRKVLRLLFVISAACICSVFIVKIYPLISNTVFKIDFSSIIQSKHVLVIRTLLFLPICALPLSWISFGWRTTNDWIHKWRIAIGVVLVLSAVLLNINNSSLGIWNLFLNKPVGYGIVFGTPRGIRSDEFAVNTPLAFSQSSNHYGYFSNLFGNSPADMFIIKDAPVITPAELFRPFHWGYLLLGSSHGLAFYSSARLVTLFLVSYQFCLLITSDINSQGNNPALKHRGLAVLGATLITFAPVIQWWYAVNGLVEMIISTFLSILLLRIYVTTHNSIKRFAAALGIMLCAGMFMLTLYPAWMIPLLFIVLALGIWVLRSSWHEIAMRFQDWFGILSVIIIFIVLMMSVLHSSFQTIQQELSTIYPGRRISNGGGESVWSLFSTMAGLAFPFKEYVGHTNATEASSFVTVFPLGIVLSFFCMWKRKNKDFLIIALLLVTLFLGLYIFVGFIPLVAALTGLSHSISARAIIMFEFANVLLLIRAASLLPDKSNIFMKISVAVCCAIQGIGVYLSYNNYLGLFWLSAFEFVGALFAITLLTKSDVFRRISTTILVMVLSISGFSVNPVQYSTDALTRQPVVEEVQKVDSKSPGKWIVAGGDSHLFAQMLVANGIPTSNALSVTPDWKLWRILDKSGRYRRAYNRYAFMSVMLVDRPLKSDEKMVTTGAFDRLDVIFNLEQLHQIGVRNKLAAGEIHTITINKYRVRQVGATISGLTPYEIITPQSE